MKKEIPILFSTAMVQAILEGRKTMTRRMVKKQSAYRDDMKLVPIKEDHISGEKYYEFRKGTEYQLPYIKCPYGKPGDIIWVRETFAEWENGGYAYKADGFIQRYGAWERDTPKKFHDVERVEKWKPCLFMPKSACRIWLEVTDVRAERLQDITEQDAIAEGVESWVEERMKSRPTHYKVYCDLDNPNDPATYSSTAKVSFESLWYKINGKESWEANPWVWVVSFKVLSTTGRPELTYTPTAIASPGQGAVIVEPVKESRYSSEFIQAAKLVVEYQAAYINLLQRKMKLGYNRCCNLMDEMEKAKIVGPLQPTKKRDVLVDSLFVLELLLESTPTPAPEKPPCDGNCGMNYCDENGCMDRKRNLVEPVPLPESKLHLSSRGIDGHTDEAKSMWDEFLMR